MEKAIGLFLAQPFLYFGILRSYSGSTIGIMTLAGTTALLVGLVLGIKKRQTKLLWLLTSVLLTHLFMAVSGLFSGSVKSGDTPILLIILTFMAIQLALLSFLIFRLRGMRVTAALISVFTLSYALVASFYGGMSFSNSWL